MVMASLVFYSWGEKWIVLVLLTSTIADYYCAQAIESGYRKIGLALSLVVNLSLLGFFKYFNFAFENFRELLDLTGISNTAFQNVPHIALPIGISFYTFQTLSYTIDIYRGKIKANRNFVDYATFVTMFPQLIAGPIVRYADIHNQLRNRDISINKFALGIERFIIGLAKKMIIANTFATVADQVFSHTPSDLSSAILWFGMLAYVIQLYYDFSGYSDMAIGMGWMLGFDFPENFNYPYIAKSVKEVWKRWHMTLSTWFKDYLYISLGGNRVAKTSRIYLNLIIVFVATGLWHGASWNFLLWGLSHGFFIMIERLGFMRMLEKSWTPVQHFYLLFVWITTFVLFRSPDLKYALAYYYQMFSFDDGNVDRVNYLSFFIFNTETVMLLIVAIVFAMPAYPFVAKKLHTFLKPASLLENGFLLLKYSFLIVLFIVSVSYIAAGSYNPFIYFRF